MCDSIVEHMMWLLIICNVVMHNTLRGIEY